MRLTGDFTVAAPPERVWAAITDPATLCRLAASCEHAERLDDTHYAGTIRARLGLVTVRARFAGEVVRADPPRTLQVVLSGSSAGLPGTYSGRAALSLDPFPQGTRAAYTVDLDVLGRLGALGESFFAPAAQRIVDKFARKLSQDLAGC